MFFEQTKVYNDGSHYIAILPKKSCVRESHVSSDVNIEVSDKYLNDIAMGFINNVAVDSINLSDYISHFSFNENSVEDVLSTLKYHSNLVSMTLKDLFDYIYNTSNSLDSKAILKRLQVYLYPFFNSLVKVNIFIKLNFQRRRRNLMYREQRIRRKAYLNDFNYFITFTYDDSKMSEKAFKTKLRMCLYNMTKRYDWQYMGVFERSPEKRRLHCHMIAKITNDNMPGELVEVTDFNFKSQRRVVTYQNTFFNLRFGRSDFKPISNNDVNSSISYMCKYLEKSGEKLFCSRGIKQYLLADIDKSDVVCNLGTRSNKLLLFDDFEVIDEGCYLGKISPDSIKLCTKCG